MVTVFSTPKPFKGHFGVIQRNAIRSWTLLRPACEVILFGDEEGTKEVAVELGVRHIPDVARNEYGTPFISDLFEQAQRSGAHDILCYVNCDTILMSDFTRAIQRVVKRKRRFLLVGRRWGLRINQELDFRARDWEQKLRAQVREAGTLGAPSGIEFFVFNRGFWGKIPAFAVGRPGWDQGILFQARSLRATLIDATPAVTAVHQDHDYSHHPKGWDGVWRGNEAKRNYQLMDHGFTTDDATHLLTPDKLRLNADLAHLGRHLHTLPMFYPFLRLPVRMFWKVLDISRPLRSAFGFRLASTRGKSSDQ
jgi:hypothetical protein